MNTIAPTPTAPACPSSRELLDLLPGSRILARGKAWVLIGNPWCECTGKPGIHRVRMNCLVLEGTIGEWVEARGWSKASFYFHSKEIHGDEVTAITEKAHL